MKKIVIPMVALASLALAGCGASASTPTPVVTVTETAAAPEVVDTLTNEEQYVAGIRSMNNPLLDSATDAQLIEMGNSVCEALAAGFSTQDIIEYMARQMVGQGMTSDVESEAVGYIIGAADTLLCPSASF